MNSDNPNTYLFKFVIIGNSGVGKSCLMNQYISSNFREEYEETIGVEFESKVLELDDDVKIQIQAWDTAGDKQFRAIARSFYRNAAAAILVYDTTNRESFEAIKVWHEDFTSLACDMVQCAIVGTKIDFEQQRQVQTEEGEQLAAQLNCRFYEVNCHCKESIDAVFNTLSFEVLRLVNNGKIDPSNDIYGVTSSNENNRSQQLNQANVVEDKEQKNDPQGGLKVYYYVLPLLLGLLLYYLIV